MSVTDGARCAACGAQRPHGELLKVTSNPTGRQHFVCRPTVGDPRCFRDGTCSAKHHSIGLA